MLPFSDAHRFAAAKKRQHQGCFHQRENCDSFNKLIAINITSLNYQETII